MMKNAKGITLTELLIAIIIMAVLAGFVIARFTGQTERAVVAEAIGILSAIRQGEAAYHLDPGPGYKVIPLAGALPADWEDIGMDTPAQVKFTYEVDAAGTATATRTTNTKTITLTIDGTWGGTHDPYVPKN